jgi:CBS domain-containing protein
MRSVDFNKKIVHDLMEDSINVDPETPVSKIIGTLREAGVYQVFSKNGGKVGMISMQDILKVTNITSRKASSTISSVPKIRPDEKVDVAVNLMDKYRIRCLPIVEDNEVIGQISTVSILKNLNRDYLNKFKVKSIMTVNPVVLRKDDLVTKARSLMVKNNIDHIPILGDKKLEGVVTSTNIVNRMLPSKSVETGAIGAEKQNRLDFDLMSVIVKPLVTCGVEDKIVDVFDNMIRMNSYYSVPLLWGELQGIVTFRDFLKLAYAEKSSLDIPVYMVGLPKDPFEAEATRDKFLRTSSGLKKAFPEIIEARSIIKTKTIRDDRRRYEVKIMISTPYESIAYSEGGYDLPSIYDILSDRMKRKLAQKPRKNKRSSRRMRME